MTFKLNRLMVQYKNYSLSPRHILTLGSLGQRSRSQGPTLTFYMKAHDLETLQSDGVPTGAFVHSCHNHVLLNYGLRKLEIKFCMQVDIFSIKTEMAYKLYTNVWENYVSQVP